MAKLTKAQCVTLVDADYGTRMNKSYGPAQKLVAFGLAKWRGAGDDFDFDVLEITEAGRAALAKESRT